MADEQLILIDFWASMFCMRPKIALAEKNITDYDCRVEDLMSDKKSSLLLDMNPVHKLIPVLIHHGKPICESLIIVEYIDEVWKGEIPFLPSDPYQKSQSKFWADYIDKKFYPASKTLWKTKESTERETAKSEFIENLKLLEEELGDKCYFGGDHFGFVDIALIPFYSWFHTYESCGNFSIEAECPKIIAWAKRCEQREAVKNSLPEMHKISELILGVRKQHLGIE
uniref:Glutathione S-transferase n=2 Tax=Chenopodium quinoa TaxID=63459 RepID=A0A803N7N7_CHEQI